jgi:hypothetical protein
MTDELTLRRVRRLSRPFEILLTIALALIVLVQVPEIIAILFLFRDGGPWHAAVSASATGINLSIFMGPGAPADVALETLSFGQRSVLALLAALCAASGGLAIFQLRQLFALYSRGAVFTEDNIRLIKRFALWLVAAAVVANVSDGVFLIVTRQPSHGVANAAMALVYGGMTWVVARVMELGRQADQERNEFV